MVEKYDDKYVRAINIEDKYSYTIPIEDLELWLEFDKKTKKEKKEILLEELAKENLQVLSLAYVYAKNLQIYGEDVTKAIYTATQNVTILEKAYNKGYYDAMNRGLSESEE